MYKTCTYESEVPGLSLSTELSILCSCGIAVETFSLVTDVLHERDKDDSEKLVVGVEGNESLHLHNIIHIRK